MKHDDSKVMIIEIYMKDLTPEKQEEIRAARGYDDCSNDFLAPLTIIIMNEDDE